MNRIYRSDIDGLRGIAVISVILFHLGYIQNGYLGVDIFFVISGYLITGIIYNEQNFSILNFYERRIRRIIPLVLFTTFVAFLLGLFLMLPDDLENLCQSIIATNFSANNILVYITSHDYWAIKNDYKPLMHTWSLGIEEQFYLMYPIIFLLLKNKIKKFVLPVLIALTILSLLLFYLSNNTSLKFFFIQYRFFELSIGGICAIYFNKRDFLSNISLGRYSDYLMFVLIAFLGFFLWFNVILNYENKIVIVLLLTSAILVLGKTHFQKKSIYKALFSNKPIVYIGKISFSLYMWHHIVFAYTRYTFVEDFNFRTTILLITLSFALSVFTYHFVENPFRNKKIIKTKPLLVILGLIFLITVSSSFYVYTIGGIIKDVPELGIKKNDFSQKFNFFDRANNIHIQYNMDIEKLDASFSENEDTLLNKRKIRILVIGDSFGRDFANILLESSFSNQIEIRYFQLKSMKTNIYRIHKSDYVFLAKSNYLPKEKFNKLVSKFNLNKDKFWVVGIKDFGKSNGIHYRNIKKNIDCRKYYTEMKNDISRINILQKDEWGNRYIDLIDLIDNLKGEVLVFTPNCKFLSHDTKHLTKFGAQFFAKKLEDKLESIMQLNQ